MKVKLKLLLIMFITLIIFIGCNTPKYDYYFIYNGKELKADRQEFRILFTEEIVNCYFYKNDNVYETCDYRKVLKKEKQWN